MGTGSQGADAQMCGCAPLEGQSCYVWWVRPHLRASVMKAFAGGGGKGGG